jgi:hypothetical protein
VQRAEESRSVSTAVYCAVLRCTALHDTLCWAKDTGQVHCMTTAGLVHVSCLVDRQCKAGGIAMAIAAGVARWGAKNDAAPVCDRQSVTFTSCEEAIVGGCPWLIIIIYARPTCEQRGKGPSTPEFTNQDVSTQKQARLAPPSSLAHRRKRRKQRKQRKQRRRASSLVTS